MKESQTNREPLSDLAYDWVTIIQHKSEALRAYQEYMRDAQEANSPECMQLMQQIYEQDARHVEEATRHLMMVLQGKMGQSQGKVSQGQGQTSQGSMGQGQTSQGSMGQGQTSQGSMGAQGQSGVGQSGRPGSPRREQGGSSQGT